MDDFYSQVKVQQEEENERLVSEIDRACAMQGKTNDHDNEEMGDEEAKAAEGNGLDREVEGKIEEGEEEEEMGDDKKFEGNVNRYCVSVLLPVEQS